MTTGLWIALLIVGCPIVIALWVVLVTVIATVHANKKGFDGVAPCQWARPIEMPKVKKPMVKKLKPTIIRLWH
jgi:hypothetical protein